MRFILLIPKGALFLLECWKDVWAGNSQHKSTEQCGTDSMNFTRGGGAFKFHFPRAPPLPRDLCFFKAPQAILMCGEFGGSTEN